MASRNESRATGAIAQLRAEGALDGKGQVEVLKLDLASPESIKAAAEEFTTKEKRLDVLGWFLFVPLGQRIHKIYIPAVLHTLKLTTRECEHAPNDQE